MKRMSEKLTQFVVKSGTYSPELYAVFQYGFQIGLEMLCCFVVCLGIAIYLHMVLEFIVFTSIFILLRTYAGGLHLNNFGSCFFCSVAVQTAVLVINRRYGFTLISAWAALVLGVTLILRLAPVESMNRELDSDEKEHCKKVTERIIAGVFVFAGCCTIGGMNRIVSLIAATVLVVMVSQYIGALKYKIEKKKKWK